MSPTTRKSRPGRAARAASPGPIVTILHLTDLHFDALAPDVGQDQRAIAYDALLKTLRLIVDGEQVPSSFGDYGQPLSLDYVVLSGDIAFRGSKEDYKQARTFMDALLRVVDLPPSRVVAAPGNHDRHTANAHGIGYPKDATQCDEWLSPAALAPSDGGHLAALVVPFLNFVEFCRKAKYVRPDGIAGLEYLTGVRSVPMDEYTIDFLVVNSAWFAHHAASDMQNMWLGLPLLHALCAPRTKGRLLPPLSGGDQDNRLVVGICHHPREWLHQEEHDSYSNRPNTFRYLAEACNVLLSGHVHGALEPPTSAHNSAQAFTGGATYGSGYYFRNNFSLLQVDFADRSVTRAGYEYDPRVAMWEERIHAAGTYPLFHTTRECKPDADVTDLAGEWKSVFWTEHQPAGRKKHRNLKLSSVGRSGFKTERGDFMLNGRLHGGYFSGQWNDSSEEAPLHGTFQLKVHDRSNMVGRWLGFDKTGEIRVGLWRFTKRTERKR